MRFVPRLNKPLLQKLIQVYYKNPYAFDPSMLNEMAEHAQYYKMPFREVEPGEADFSPIRAGKNFIEGFIQGYTTLRLGQEPINEYERIVRAVGSVMGFTGTIPFVGPTTPVLGALAGKSIPGRIAKSVTDKVSTSVAGGVAKLAGNTFVDKAMEHLSKPLAQDLMQSTFNVGLSSALSQIWSGPGAMAQSFLGGARHTAGRTLLTNFIATGHPGTDIALRTLAGGIFSGLPSTIRKESAPQQVYDFLTGALFSYRDLPAAEKLAMMAMPELQKEFFGKGVEGLETMPSFQKLHKDVQEQVRTNFVKLFGTTQQAEVAKAMLKRGLQEKLGVKLSEEAIQELETKKIMSKKELNLLVSEETIRSNIIEKIPEGSTAEEAKKIIEEEIPKEIAKAEHATQKLKEIKKAKQLENDVVEEFVKDNPHLAEDEEVLQQVRAKAKADKDKTVEEITTELTQKFIEDNPEAADNEENVTFIENTVKDAVREIAEYDETIPEEPEEVTEEPVKTEEVTEELDIPEDQEIIPEHVEEDEIQSLAQVENSVDLIYDYMMEEVQANITAWKDYVVREYNIKDLRLLLKPQIVENPELNDRLPMSKEVMALGEIEGLSTEGLYNHEHKGKHDPILIISDGVERTKEGYTELFGQRLDPIIGDDRTPVIILDKSYSEDDPYYQAMKEYLEPKGYEDLDGRGIFLFQGHTSEEVNLRVKESVFNRIDMYASYPLDKNPAVASANVKDKLALMFVKSGYTKEAAELKATSVGTDMMLTATPVYDEETGEYQRKSIKDFHEFLKKHRLKETDDLVNIWNYMASRKASGRDIYSFKAKGFIAKDNLMSIKLDSERSLDDTRLESVIKRRYPGDTTKPVRTVAYVHTDKRFVKVYETMIDDDQMGMLETSRANIYRLMMKDGYYFFSGKSDHNEMNFVKEHPLVAKYLVAFKGDVKAAKAYLFKQLKAANPKLTLKEIEQSYNIDLEEFRKVVTLTNSEFVFDDFERTYQDDIIDVEKAYLSNYLSNLMWVMELNEIPIKINPDSLGIMFTEGLSSAKALTKRAQLFNTNASSVLPEDWEYHANKVANQVANPEILDEMFEVAEEEGEIDKMIEYYPSLPSKPYNPELVERIKSGKFNSIIIVNDITTKDFNELSLTNSKPEEWQAYQDGAYHAHPLVIDVMNASQGLPKIGGSSKSHQVNGANGPFLGKNLGMKAGTASTKFMEDFQVDIMYLHGSVKHSMGRNVVKLSDIYKYADGQISYEDMLANIENSKFNDVTINDFRFIPTTFFSKNNIEGRQTLVRQLYTRLSMSVFDGEQDRVAAREFIEYASSLGMRGDHNTTQAFKKLVSRPKLPLKEFRRALRDIDNIDIGVIIEVLGTASNEVKFEVIKAMAARSKLVNLDDFNSGEDNYDLFYNLKKTRSDVDKFLNINHDLIIAQANPQFTKFIEDVVTKYLSDRVLKPKIGNSASFAVGTPDPLNPEYRNLFVNEDGTINHDYMYLGREGRNIKIKLMVDEPVKDSKKTIRTSKEFTLGELWDNYRLGKYQGGMKQKVQDVFNNVLGVRVPQDSIEGAQKFIFKGFLDTDSISIFISPVRMEELGGADNDGDKIHVYFTGLERKQGEENAMTEKSFAKDDSGKISYRDKFEGEGISKEWIEHLWGNPKHSRRRHRGRLDEEGNIIDYTLSAPKKNTQKVSDGRVASDILYGITADEDPLKDNRNVLGPMPSLMFNYAHATAATRDLLGVASMETTYMSQLMEEIYDSKQKDYSFKLGEGGFVKYRIRLKEDIETAKKDVTDLYQSYIAFCADPGDAERQIQSNQARTDIFSYLFDIYEIDAKTGEEKKLNMKTLREGQSKLISMLSSRALRGYREFNSKFNSKDFRNDSQWGLNDKKYAIATYNRNVTNSYFSDKNDTRSYNLNSLLLRQVISDIGFNMSSLAKDRPNYRLYKDIYSTLYTIFDRSFKNKDILMRVKMAKSITMDYVYEDKNIFDIINYMVMSKNDPIGADGGLSRSATGSFISILRTRRSRLPDKFAEGDLPKEFKTFRLLNKGYMSEEMDDAIQFLFDMENLSDSMFRKNTSGQYTDPKMGKFITYLKKLQTLKNDEKKEAFAKYIDVDNLLYMFTDGEGSISITTRDLTKIRLFVNNVADKVDELVYQDMADIASTVMLANKIIEFNNSMKILEQQYQGDKKAMDDLDKMRAAFFRSMNESMKIASNIKSDLFKAEDWELDGLTMDSKKKTSIIGEVYKAKSDSRLGKIEGILREPSKAGVDAYDLVMSYESWFLDFFLTSTFKGGGKTNLTSAAYRLDGISNAVVREYNETLQHIWNVSTGVSDYTDTPLSGVMGRVKEKVQGIPVKTKTTDLDEVTPYPYIEARKTEPPVEPVATPKSQEEYDPELDRPTLPNGEPILPPKVSLTEEEEDTARTFEVTGVSTNVPEEAPIKVTSRLEIVRTEPTEYEELIKARIAYKEKEKRIDKIDRDLKAIDGDISELEIFDKISTVIPKEDMGEVKEIIDKLMVHLETQGFIDKNKPTGVMLNHILGFFRGVSKKSIQLMNLEDWRTINRWFDVHTKPSFWMRISGKGEDFFKLTHLDYYKAMDTISKEHMRKNVLLYSIPSYYKAADGTFKLGTVVEPTQHAGHLQNVMSVVQATSIQAEKTLTKEFLDALEPYMQSDELKTMYEIGILMRELRFRSTVKDPDQYRSKTLKSHINYIANRIVELSGKVGLNAEVKGAEVIFSGDKTFQVTRMTEKGVYEDSHLTANDVVNAHDMIINEANVKAYSLVKGVEELNQRFKVKDPIKYLKDETALQMPELDDADRGMLDDMVDFRALEEYLLDYVIKNKELPLHIGIDMINKAMMTKRFVESIVKGKDTSEVRLRNLFSIFAELNTSTETGKIVTENYYPMLDVDFVKMKPIWEKDLKEYVARYREIATKLEMEPGNIELAAELNRHMYNIINTYNSLKQQANASFLDTFDNREIEMIADIMEEANKGKTNYEKVSGYSKIVTTARNQLERTSDQAFYNMTPDGYVSYIRRIAGAASKSAGYFLAKNHIENIENTSALGDMSIQWSKFFKMYVNEALGRPNIITEDLLEDPKMKIKGSLYAYFSDSMMINRIHNLKKSLGLVENKYNLPEEFLKPSYDDVIRLSQAEARYEIMTLLAHTKSTAANLFGGAMTTSIYTGFPLWKNVQSTAYVSKNIHPSLDSSTEIYRWVEKHGVVEEHLMYEGGIASKQYGSNFAKFFNAAMEKIKENPDYDDISLSQLARSYGVTDKLFDTATGFMRFAERKNRKDAFVASYIQAKEMFGGMDNSAFRDGEFFGDPVLVELAKKGVKNTQFLYSAIYRPAFMRTSFGKIVSRFQTWTFNHFKFRSEIYEQAKIYGYKPGTIEMDRFQRFAAMDILSLALSQVFVFSIFESRLPPPFNYIKDFSDWMFGDEEEKKNAFMGAYPYPIAPLQLITPPVLRWVPNMVTGIVGGGWKDFTNYTVWTMFPFGRMTRDIRKSMEAPNTIIDRMTGVPVSSMGNLVTGTQSYYIKW